LRCTRQLEEARRASRMAGPKCLRIGGMLSSWVRGGVCSGMGHGEWCGGLGRNDLTVG